MSSAVIRSRTSHSPHILLPPHVRSTPTASTMAAHCHLPLAVMAQHHAIVRRLSTHQHLSYGRQATCQVRSTQGNHASIASPDNC